MKESPKIIRPWGGYTILKKTKTYWVKKLFIDKNARLSLQCHEYRDEILFVLEGCITAIVGNKEIMVHKGELVHIPKQTKHRIIGLKKTCVLETAYGKVLERDIVRYDDDYGRS